MNKTIVSVWVDKGASLRLLIREEEKHAEYKYALSMNERNLIVDSEIIMSQEGLNLLVKTLAPSNSKEIDLWTVCMHPKEAKLMEDAITYHFMNKEKAELKMKELQEKYPNDSIYIIESTVE